MTATTQQAAGGVLWRDDDKALEVAVVHRPRYDDWTLPKGKLHAGEHALRAAYREVVEETGWRGVVGRPLGVTRYDRHLDGRALPKEVRYWAMRAVGREPWSPTAEVSEVRWLSGDAAMAMLSYSRDREPLARLLAGPAATTTVLLVRHGSAGDPEDWSGDDRLRPLDGTGHKQAEAIRDVLPVFGPRRIVSPDVLRCVETVRPLAEALGLPMEDDPLFAETAYWDRRDIVAERVRTMAATGEPVVIASQGGAIPDLVATLRGDACDEPAPARKGSVWSLSFAGEHLVTAEYFADLGVKRPRPDRAGP